MLTAVGLIFHKKKGSYKVLFYNFRYTIYSSVFHLHSSDGGNPIHLSRITRRLINVCSTCVRSIWCLSVSILLYGQLVDQ